MLLGMDSLLNAIFVPLGFRKRGFRGTGVESCYVSRLRCQMSTLSRKLSLKTSKFVIFVVTASHATYLSDPSDVVVPQSQNPASHFQPLTQPTCFLLSGDQG